MKLLKPAKTVKSLSPEEYANSLVWLNPQAVIISRHIPKEVSAGGIVKPQTYRDREARSTIWGKILRISAQPSEDSNMVAMRQSLRLGDYVNFLATNPINGGYAVHKNVQLIAVEDILFSISPECFEKYIAIEDL